MKITRAIYPLIVTAAILAACSSAESDWKKADSQNTTAAYQDFLTQHPNDAHAQDARDRIKKLEDEQAWADAQKTNTADAYQQYLQNVEKHLPKESLRSIHLASRDFVTAPISDLPLLFPSVAAPGPGV